MIDYKELLRKYMDYVAEEEGTTFVNPYMEDFTEEERLELLKMDGSWSQEISLSWHQETSKEPLVRSPKYTKVVKEQLLKEIANETSI